MFVVYDLSAFGSTLVVNVYQYFHLRQRTFEYWRLRLQFPSAADLQARLRNCAYVTLNSLPSPISNKVRSLVSAIYPPTATVVHHMDDLPPTPTLESHSPLPSFRPTSQPTSPLDPFRDFRLPSQRPSPIPSATIQPTSPLDLFRDIRLPSERTPPLVRLVDTPPPPQVSYTMSSTTPNFEPPTLTSSDAGHNASVQILLLACSLLALFAVLSSVFRRASRNTSSHSNTSIQDSLVLASDNDSSPFARTVSFSGTVGPVQNIPGLLVSGAFVNADLMISSLDSCTTGFNVSASSSNDTAPTVSDSTTSTGGLTVADTTPVHSHSSTTHVSCDLAEMVDNAEDDKVHSPVSSGSDPLAVTSVTIFKHSDMACSADGASTAIKSGDHVSDDAEDITYLVTGESAVVMFS